MLGVLLQASAGQCCSLCFEPPPGGCCWLQRTGGACPCAQRAAVRAELPGQGGSAAGGRGWGEELDPRPPQHLAPGAWPRVPARAGAGAGAGADAHLTTTLLVRGRAGGEQPCGETAPGLGGSVGPFICKHRYKAQRHTGPSHSHSVSAPWSCQACAAQPHSAVGHSPRGLQQQRAHPGHSEQPAGPGPPPGGRGLSSQPPEPPGSSPSHSPGCWGPAVPPPHSHLSQDLVPSPRGCWCRAPFPPASLGAGPQPWGPIYCYSLCGQGEDPTGPRPR